MFATLPRRTVAATALVTEAQNFDAAVFDGNNQTIEKEFSTSVQNSEVDVCQKEDADTQTAAINRAAHTYASEKQEDAGDQGTKSAQVPASSSSSN